MTITIEWLIVPIMSVRQIEYGAEIEREIWIGHDNASGHKWFIAFSIPQFSILERPNIVSILGVGQITVQFMFEMRFLCRIIESILRVCRDRIPGSNQFATSPDVLKIIEKAVVKQYLLHMQQHMRLNMYWLYHQNIII
jgi:hypothetical protein